MHLFTARPRLAGAGGHSREVGLPCGSWTRGGCLQCRQACVPGEWCAVQARAHTRGSECILSLARQPTLLRHRTASLPKARSWNLRRRGSSMPFRRDSNMAAKTWNARDTTRGGKATAPEGETKAPTAAAAAHSPASAGSAGTPVRGEAGSPSAAATSASAAAAATSSRCSHSYNQGARADKRAWWSA